MRAAVMRRGEGSVARFVPTATILILALLSVLPLRFPDYAAVAPLLALAGIYYWTIYRPNLLPPAAVFLCGLVLDLLSGAPLGVAALVFLLGSVLTGVMLDMRAAALQWVLTVACFPAVAYLLMRVQRGFLPSP